LERVFVNGPAGRLQVVIQDPGAQRLGVALIAHPHPLYGGTLDNKVVQTLAKAFHAAGYAALRLNFRGVDESEGVYDDGRGEVEDFAALAAYARERYADAGLSLAGFSFGGYVAAALAQRLHPVKLVLIAPAVGRFPVAAVPPDTLVVHGEEDDVVPFKDVLDWARPSNLPVVTFPGAGHFFHGLLVPLQKIVFDHVRS
jgi:alpha/beta superfamily hydrolase